MATRKKMAEPPHIKVLVNEAYGYEIRGVSLLFREAEWKGRKYLALLIPKDSLSEYEAEIPADDK